MSPFSRILVIGAAGQIGSELTLVMRERYGAANVVASDVHPLKDGPLKESGPHATLDIRDRSAIAALVKQHDCDCIVNLAALLSATAEQHVQAAWEINIGGHYNTLEVARELGLKQVFCPSSIAAFGPTTPRDNTPQSTVLEPTTIYGVTKVSGELLGNYYFQRFGVDCRGLRYPGIISSDTLPGGGTTDYAVDIFYQAIQHGSYECFLREDTMLPMMYMPDCIKCTLDLMEADREKLSNAAGYNITAMSFTAGELAAEIKKHLPEFTVTYVPDVRQNYADSWPRSIDDSAARSEWGWQHDFDMPTMVADMLAKLTPRLKGNGAAG
ncbi:MAG: NAD-dependent epimerase/dehydratase family protein [Planctomycetales bacterium]|nr:NAD-dependent epimerase/dehydratase family protein [bacterium]UNM08508.1 MAG: NAD-dependent epimerase/dehydratase family protein [Planctomycetales bacterium]